MLAPTIHAPGVYFGLSEDLYHADPALGSTSIKGIAIDVIEWQFDRLYGEDKDTDALLYGQAIHKRMLEGRAAFEAKFCTEFDKSTLPEGALDTVADLKDWLAARDQGPLTRPKPDLIKMVQRIDPIQPIVEVLKAQWAESYGTKIPLKPRRWAQVETAARWVQRDPLLSAVMEDGTFIAGAPEVSIFYEDRGVRLKARFDRLLRHAIVDVKNFAVLFAGPLETTALKTIMRMRYDIQAADYLRAWHVAKNLAKEGHVFGDEPHPGFLGECFDREEPKWIWVMIKSTGAPQPLVIDWDAKLAKGAAADQVERAIEKYIELREKFGDENEWPPMRPALTLTDSDLPQYFGQ